MKMSVVHSEKRLCTCCMEEHVVKTVRVKEHINFKNTPVDYDATYYLCEEAEELYADEVLMSSNDVIMKDAYRKALGLLASTDIHAIREKYTISQSDFCVLLGWGGKTITRYESHQVQDKAHDSILKKIDQDPEWFLELLVETRDSFSAEAFRKYYEKATELFEKSQDAYLRKSIEACYVKFKDKQMYSGNTVLSLDKVVDVIRYFASASKVTNLYKVKLMKLMWYADALSFKRRGTAITGLVYQALPMGAVPIAHDSIVGLRGVPCEEEDMGDGTAYHFNLPEGKGYPFLDKEDRAILDEIIQKLGNMTKSEIVAFMHKEHAYTETTPRDIISYKYVDSLQI